MQSYGPYRDMFTNEDSVLQISPDIFFTMDEIHLTLLTAHVHSKGYQGTHSR